MRLTMEDCRKIVDSDTEMLFLYHIKEDRLYFSNKICTVFGWEKEVKRYWKESDNWTYISQQSQEDLVNIVRHEMLDDESVKYRVFIENKQCAGEYEAELSAVWADKENWVMEAIQGRLVKAG